MQLSCPIVCLAVSAEEQGIFASRAFADFETASFEATGLSVRGGD